jgi:hypothetical protein
MEIECSKKEANYYYDGIDDSIEFLLQVEPDNDEEKQIMKQCLCRLKKLKNIFREKSKESVEKSIIKSMEEGLNALKKGEKLPTTFVPEEKVFRMKYSRMAKK